MSIFGGIKNIIKKTEAELILENLLQIQFKVLYIHENPSRLAEKLVSEVWQSQPDVFDGKFGQRPFKLTVAAAALSYAIKRLDKDNPNRVALIMSLGNLFSELEVNEKLYPLNSLDHKLLEESLGVLKLEMSEILNSSPYGGVVSQFEDTVLPASKEVQKDADLVTTLLTTSSQMNKSKGESSNNEKKVDNSKTFDLSNSSNNDTAAKQQASDSTDKKKDNPSIPGIHWIIYLLFLIIIFMVILGMYLLSGEEPVEVYETPLISNKSVPLREKATLESSGPSFDCTKVSNVVEILICNDFELSELDINLSDKYRIKKVRLRGATLNVLKSQQYAWLKKRNDCKTVNCIKRAYINRIREVSNYEDVQKKSEYKNLGNIDFINYKIQYSEHGAIIKPDNSSELIFLGKDCDVYSKKLGKGIWNFHDNKPGFWIEFNSGTVMATNIYGYGIDPDWYLNMPFHASNCSPAVTSGAPSSSCSSDPQLNKNMDFGTVKKQLTKHGWELDAIDENECSGTGLGYCLVTASDCINRILYITTVGGISPTGISHYKLGTK
jgi:uncharacterized protein YecT (DUF1311 family)